MLHKNFKTKKNKNTYKASKCAGKLTVWWENFAQKVVWFTVFRIKLFNHLYSPHYGRQKFKKIITAYNANKYAVQTVYMWTQVSVQGLQAICIKLQNGHKNSWSNTKTPAIHYVQLFALYGNYTPCFIK